MQGGKDTVWPASFPGEGARSSRADFPAALAASPAAPCPLCSGSASGAPAGPGRAGPRRAGSSARSVTARPGAGTRVRPSPAARPAWSPRRPPAKVLRAPPCPAQSGAHLSAAGSSSGRSCRHSCSAARLRRWDGAALGIHQPPARRGSFLPFFPPSPRWSSCCCCCRRCGMKG